MDKEQREWDKLEFEKLRQLLNAPRAPQELSARLKANLEKLVQEPSSRSASPLTQQKTSQKSPQRSSHVTRRRKKLAFGLAAGLALTLVVTLFQFRTESGFIALAYAHTQEEAGLSGAQDGGYEKWFKTAGLRIPAEASDIVLSKNCVLGHLKTKHLRFDLPKQGTVNLFLYKDGAGAPGRSAVGNIAGQQWMTVSPGGEIHLLAIYEAGVNERQVAQIIRSMFDGDSA